MEILCLKVILIDSSTKFINNNLNFFFFLINKITILLLQQILINLSLN